MLFQVESIGQGDSIAVGATGKNGNADFNAFIFVYLYRGPTPSFSLQTSQVDLGGTIIEVTGYRAIAMSKTGS